MNKPKISYTDFLDMKNSYLKDADPLLTFGATFCAHFGILSDRIKRTSSVAEARVAIDAVVDWV